MCINTIIRHAIIELRSLRYTDEHHKCYTTPKPHWTGIRPTVHVCVYMHVSVDLCCAVETAE